jgi:hypothetical protein
VLLDVLDLAARGVLALRLGVGLQGKCLELGEPLQVLVLNAVLHEGLDSVVVGLLLDLDLLHVEHVVPETMVSFVMVEEPVSTPLELKNKP